MTAAGAALAKRKRMTTRKNTSTRKPEPAQPATSAAQALDASVLAFAEHAGRVVGTLRARTEGLANRQSLTDHLTRIRDGAADLLDRLAKTPDAASNDGDAAAATLRRSRGQVDAPGKAHRKAPTPMHGVKHSNLMIPKVKAAQTMRRPQRRG
jgi:hypothetical protein